MSGKLRRRESRPRERDRLLLVRSLHAAASRRLGVRTVSRARRAGAGVRGASGHYARPGERAAGSDGDALWGCMPYSSESTSASHEAAMRFSETPIEPHIS